MLAALVFLLLLGTILLFPTKVAFHREMKSILGDAHPPDRAIFAWAVEYWRRRAEIGSRRLDWLAFAEVALPVALAALALTFHALAPEVSPEVTSSERMPAAAIPPGLKSILEVLGYVLIALMLQWSIRREYSSKGFEARLRGSWLSPLFAITNREAIAGGGRVLLLLGLLASMAWAIAAFALVRPALP